MRYSCAIFDYRRVFAALELNLLLGKGWRPHAEEPTLGNPSSSHYYGVQVASGGPIGGRNLPMEVGSPQGTLMESETNRVSNYEFCPRIA